MSHHPPMEAMVKLAMSAKVKGSGNEIDRVRKLQHQACAFIGSAALLLQKQGLDHWLEVSAEAKPSRHYLRGWQLSWDEASQKLRAMVGKSPKLQAMIESKAATRVEVMAVLASVCQLEATEQSDGSVQRKLDSQPWLASPMVLPKCDTAHIVEGLLRSLPCNVSQHASMKQWCEGATCILGLFCLDSASANLSTL